MRRALTALLCLIGIASPAYAIQAVGNGSVSIPVPISQGGTGSTTQNFTDLTTTQTVGGTKMFTSQLQLPNTGVLIGTAAGTPTTFFMFNSAGSANQESVLGNGTANFGATCSTVVPHLFAIADLGGSCFFAWDKNGNFGAVNLVANGHVNQGAASQYAKRAALVAGTTTFTFSTAFASTPVCVAIGEGSVVNILKAVPSTTTCVVTSASGIDTQTVDILAIGNPN